MPSLGSWSRYSVIALITFHSSFFTVLAVPEVLPKHIASHFCQLFINDGEEILPLSYHARRILSPDDSLTVEQLFTSYIFQQDNWQVLRIFPHQSDDDTVNWYAPADDLPASLGTEHQKYIREVLPRLQREITAGNWPVVDDCIDKMIRYQCKYGGKSAQTSTVPTYFLYIFALFLAIFWLFTRLFVTLRPKRNKQ